MKAFEVKKGGADIQHGRVMMAIEGKDDLIAIVDKELRKQFDSCEYAEEGDAEGETAFFFMIDRTNKAYFMQQWKLAKAQSKQTPPKNS
jgi:hypothetical protein